MQSVLNRGSSSNRLWGPGLVALVCLVPALLWFAAAPLGLRVRDLASGLTAAGVLCGLTGISAFAVNLFLGARWWFAERAFGSLDSMYRIHRMLGRTAFWLVAVHALLLLWGAIVASGSGGLAMLLPSNGWTVPLGAVALVVMGVTLALTLYARMGHEMFIYVHRFFGVAFVLGALHAFLTPGTKAISPALTVYLLALAALGALGYGYRSLFGEAAVKRGDFDVVHIHPRGDALEILMAPRSEMFDYLPGQFVFLTFESDTLQRAFHPFDAVAEGTSELVTFRAGAVRNQFHPFSITSAPGNDTLGVTIKASGDYTSALRFLKEGDRARVEGPFGSFSSRLIANRLQVWIAGGIGVTPFVSMARSLGTEGPDVVLVYAVKRWELAHYGEELAAIDARLPNLRLIPYPENERGRITADELARLCPDLDRRDVMVCGPPKMIYALRDQLLAGGFARKRLHYEEFNFTKAARERTSGGRVPS